MRDATGKLPALLLGSLMVLVAAAACVENTPANKAPVARIGSPVNAATFDTGVVITFDGTGSYDPEKKALTFNWSFGDNTTGTGNITTHSYSLPGKYIVSLEVYDGKKRGTDRAELNILQANRAPVVKFKASYTSVSNEETVDFNASETTDADNDNMTFGWTFGDGSSAVGKLASHLYTAVGAYNVTLNVSDGKTTAAGMMAISVYQANRPPVPVLRATPLVAFLNSTIEFDASGSTDADNDTLEVAWNFGDGTNGTGLKAGHAYTHMGNYTVVGTVRDAKLERTANIIITVIPRARILLDWNGTDYGYIVQTETNVEKGNLGVTVAKTGVAGPAATITELTPDRYRATSSILPSKGATLTVTAKYLGNTIATRTLTIYEGTALPGNDCTATVESTLGSHAVMADSEEWMNLTAAGEVKVSGWHADYRLRIINGSMDNVNDAGEDQVRVGHSDIYQGWFNQTFDYGVAGNLSVEIWGRGNSTTTNTSSDQVTERLYSEMIMKTFDRDATYLYQYINGTQGWLNLTMRTDTLGIEEKANGNGAIFPCIKTRTNSTGEGISGSPFGTIHLLMFGESTSWVVQSDRWTNSTIYTEFVQNVYSVNDTTGAWTLLPEYSASGSEYPDANGDGIYNPDIAPVSKDDAYEFHGLVPRELVVGDRITGTNQYGMHVIVEVLEESTREVGGVVYDVVLVKSTYDHEGGNGNGTTDAWVVSTGNLTGLPLETSDVKSWTNDLKTETSSSEMKVVEVRED